MKQFETISPIDDSVYSTTPYHSEVEVEELLSKAKASQVSWAALSLSERIKLLEKFVELFYVNKDEIAREITQQMGRPISQSGGEVEGFKERASYLIKVAKKGLSPYHLDPDEEQEGFERYLVKEPLGVVAVLSPWNYPFLTSINVICPALLAGNTVIFKPSHQTPLVANRYYDTFKKAGLPKGVFDFVHLDHENTAKLIGDVRVDGVFFTGSVAGGVAVQKAITHKFIPCGLELGGKDPAYVRKDADLENTVVNLVDGAFFNSGQSCCGIERIYVDDEVYDEFVGKFVEITKGYQLGNSLENGVNLGPMVNTKSADYVRKQIEEAVKTGAKSLVDESLFPKSKVGTPYLSPHVLVDVNHHMSVMKDESFGPVIGIMPVKSDGEALQLMNDSDYGLTASVWTSDIEKARELASRVKTGTVFLNRCDYLDPALAWTGVKNTGRGISLSVLGYDQVTRVKSIHFKI